MIINKSLVLDITFCNDLYCNNQYGTDYGYDNHHLYIVNMNIK